MNRERKCSKVDNNKATESDLENRSGKKKGKSKEKSAESDSDTDKEVVTKKSRTKKKAITLAASDKLLRQVCPERIKCLDAPEKLFKAFSPTINTQ